MNFVGSMHQKLARRRAITKSLTLTLGDSRRSEAIRPVGDSIAIAMLPRARLLPVKTDARQDD